MIEVAKKVRELRAYVDANDEEREITDYQKQVVPLSLTYLGGPSQKFLFAMPGRYQWQTGYLWV